MRPRIPDRNFPTESKRTVSKTHSAFNSLRRRLSTRKDSSSFGGAQAQAEDQNKMPKHTNGVRGGSSKRRDVTSDQKTDQELRSLNSLDFSHDNTGGSQTPTAVLASSNGALQRLADIAQYFESSFTYDINAVEGAYGTEMERENEIKRLNKTVETLTHVKSKEMENLRHENRELKAEQEACDQERKRCQKMQEELEAQHAIAEASRHEENNRKLQEEKAKLHKHVRMKKAEVEEEYKQKVRELEDQKEQLSAINEKLKQRLSAAEEKLGTKKIRHARVEKSLEEENKKLTVELKQVKSEFPVEGQPVEYYADKFRQISDAVKAVSSKYFRKLPERAMTDPEAIHQELRKLNPIFNFTPIWQTQISEFFRVRDVQHVISICLCDCIWQPFFPQDSLPNRQGVGQFLEAVSESLSARGGRSESAWRVLTLRGIDALGGSILEPSPVEPTVQRVLDILRPLTVPSESAGFEEDLVGIVKKSVTLWEAARKDEAKFVVVKQPDPSDQEKWQAQDMCGLEEASMPPDEKIDTTGIEPLCLFPNILQITSRGEPVVLHQGSALFPTSQVWIQGMLEKKEQEEALVKAVSDARSKVNARRTSFPRGPNSPAGGKFPLAQT